jgi:hypothetical protein
MALRRVAQVVAVTALVRLALDVLLAVRSEDGFNLIVSRSAILRLFLHEVAWPLAIVSVTLLLVAHAQGKLSARFCLLLGSALILAGVLIPILVPLTLPEFINLPQSDVKGLVIFLTSLYGPTLLLALLDRHLF